MFSYSNPRPVLTLGVSALLLCALLTITLYVYSPWHRHDRLSRQQCDFAQFELGANHHGTESLILPPEVRSSVWEAAGITMRSAFWDSSVFSSRAPPARS